MEMICIPCCISMCAAVSKFDEWRSNFTQKCLMLFVVGVVMETMLHTCVPSFILCVLQIASLRSEKKFLNKSAWGYLLLLSSWKRCNTHAHQVSSLCVVLLASLRSEEVILKKSAWGFFKQYTVVMETCNRHGNDTRIFTPKNKWQVEKSFLQNEGDVGMA